MANISSALRHRAEAYRQVSLEMRTPEVQRSLCRLADEFDRRAEIITRLADPARAPAQVEY